MKKLMLAMACLISTYAYALQTGTYELWGSSHPTGEFNYRGEVCIAPQGENYSLFWKIGNSNVQVGVGILRKDVLSVAYHDLSQNTDGVASFCQISENVLEGKWTGFKSNTYGREYLVWKSPFIDF
ncbi:MAG TPA: hypothetical protein VLG76_01660 [Rhabdochlamydiaceae bacterium]|nr:hypothetical protein [Rhabdochlamydiaceae bacterium]